MPKEPAPETLDRFIFDRLCSRRQQIAYLKRGKWPRTGKNAEAITELRALFEWIPVVDASPEDEERYDIRLHDGQILKDAEYWAFGGGFCPTQTEGPELPESPVKWPLDEVAAFRKAADHG